MASTRWVNRWLFTLRNRFITQLHRAEFYLNRTQWVAQYRVNLFSFLGEFPFAAAYGYPSGFIRFLLLYTAGIKNCIFHFHFVRSVKNYFSLAFGMQVSTLILIKICSLLDLNHFALISSDHVLDNSAMTALGPLLEISNVGQTLVFLVTSLFWIKFVL